MFTQTESNLLSNIYIDLVISDPDLHHSSTIAILEYDSDSNAPYRWLALDTANSEILFTVADTECQRGRDRLELIAIEFGTILYDNN